MATLKQTRRLGEFTDLQPILDAALAAGGGSYTLETHGQAVHWRQRAYVFRKLYAEVYATKSKYDTLTMPRIADESSTVVIRVNSAKGTFEPVGDSPVLDTIYEEDDDLLDIAAAFAKKIGGQGA